MLVSWTLIMSNFFQLNWIFWLKYDDMSDNRWFSYVCRATWYFFKIIWGPRKTRVVSEIVLYQPRYIEGAVYYYPVTRLNRCKIIHRSPCSTYREDRFMWGLWHLYLKFILTKLDPDHVSSYIGQASTSPCRKFWLTGGIGVF